LESPVKIFDLTGEDVNTKADVLVVDSRLVAQELDIEHRALRQTIEKYLTELQEFGVVTFEMSKPSEGSQGGRPERFCYLNEDQAIFVMTLSRNTEKVVKCKANLVKAFKQAKEQLEAIAPEKEIIAPRQLPDHSAVEYAHAAHMVETLPDNLLKQLVRDALIDEISLKQNLKYLPVAEKPKQYTIAKIRAKQLGYSDKQIGDGKQLGKFVKSQLTPSFQEIIGRYPVYHYEINEFLDSAIQRFFK
jgi:phage regulator Rha-like protein